MGFSKLLIANRGEIAIRIARAAAQLGIDTVAVFAQDDARCLHVKSARHAMPLTGAGVAAYLDAEQLVDVATRTGCDAVHPGYGFLSENARFAQLCNAAGTTFVGPSAALLTLFGDKVAARTAARAAGVAVLEGSTHAASPADAHRFFAALPTGAAMVIKAVSGGGGRGMRIVTSANEIDAAHQRCCSEALTAFGDASVYVERFCGNARHIEVQIVADHAGHVSHLGERDCSVQRRHQKIVEIAPSPALTTGIRQQIIAAAVQFAAAVRYENIGTFEFLATREGEFAFIEANPRLQVEHTVTEAVTGVDIVCAQIRLAEGATLHELGLDTPPLPRGYAVQVRVNMERMNADGSVAPTGGTLTAFEPPSGPGIRTDTFGYSGYTTSASYDSLLAKVIGHSSRSDFAAAVAATYRALGEFRIEGVATNIAFLQNLLTHPKFVAGDLHTRFLDEEAEALVAPAEHDRWFFAGHSAADAGVLAGTRLGTKDPLAVLTFGQTQAERKSQPTTPAASANVLDGTVAVAAPLQGTVVMLNVSTGDAVRVGQQVAVMESMKMEHEIRASVSGSVARLGVLVGDTVYEGHALLYIEPGAVEADVATVHTTVDLDHIRPDLAEVVERHARTRDAARPEAVARRRKTGQRTARENVDDLCDPGTFVEYGALVLAAQRRRRSIDDLIANTPADGMITGVGAINGAQFGDPACRCAVMAYDYTVLAGTQGGQNHRKTDRMVEVAEHGQMPMVLFAEGGGGRPGDTDGVGVSTQTTFARFAQLSALVPMVGITSGRCFAGNASLLGCCDVIIATAGSNIGMGGPAMIEGGGLGIYAPEDIGPLAVQVANGVVDIAVADEAEAVQIAKRYLGYFQGRLNTWDAPDQRLLRRIVRRIGCACTTSAM